MGTHDERAKTASIADATDRIALARGALRRLTLLLYHRGGVEIVPLKLGTAVVVGRDASSDVVVQDDSLSRRHARFTLVDGNVMVEDLGSTNGTRVDDQRLERAVLTPGQVVHLGTVAAGVHAFSGTGALPGTDSHDALRAIVELDLARARYFRRSFAVLTVRAHKGKDAHVSRFCHRVQEILRPVDRVAIYGPVVVDILLPEVSVEEATALARRIVAELPGVPQLFCGVAMFPDAGASADALFEAAHASANATSPGEPVRIAVPLGARVLSADVEDTIAGLAVVRSPATRALFEMAGRLSRTRIPVLLIGETGTGKEVLAKAIHHAGPRRQEPMICVNCGAIPRDLVESTLFGHEKGAFTGALQLNQGVFESARGGTVLLDELGELTPAAQIALLRVLETKRITRVGSTKEIEVDVRMIAATHRNLEAMTEAGTFRHDLLYRLNAVTLVLPPLRERRDDIVPLARHFLEQANREDGRFIVDFEPAALSLLQAYRWPGNARELRNAVLRAVALATGDLVRVDDLPDRIRVAVGDPAQGTGGDGGARSGEAESDRRGMEQVGIGAASPERGSGGAGKDYASRMVSREVEILAEALRETGWNQTKAAQNLEMPLRTLQHKIKVLGLKKPDLPKAL